VSWTSIIVPKKFHKKEKKGKKTILTLIQNTLFHSSHSPLLRDPNGTSARVSDGQRRRDGGGERRGGGG